MQQLLAILAFIGVLMALVWLPLGRRSAGAGDEVIDPNDPRQIGLLIGLTNGTITAAAIARYALDRFEKEHGRKATVKEMAFVAGMMTARRT